MSQRPSASAEEQPVAPPIGLSAVALKQRRLPIGAEITPDGMVSFRVWAPKRNRVEVIANVGRPDDMQQIAIPLLREPDQEGYFSLVTKDVCVGALYGFRLDDEEKVWPDPASRFQPDGPFGLSELIDPAEFAWTDQDWRGRTSDGQVIYELHIGTFTKSGDWRAASAELSELAAAGMTIVQVMPVADFPGSFGWGYDGVNQFSPTRLYGRPDDFRAFVDTAHRVGMGVILDVVYNHWGMVGNFIGQFSANYMSMGHKNDWGDTPNFDDEHSAPVREYFTSNARYWIDEFHLDGFRFDATQAVHDHSSTHILTDITVAARDAANGRSIVMAAENELQEARIVQPLAAGGHGCDWICNDDYHHAARVRLTDTNSAYYSDFLGTAAELVASVRHGFIYQGQWSQWQQKPRGTPSKDLAPKCFVHFLQNHDQIANSITGERIDKLTSPSQLRAMTGLWLLSPQTPMFFQGQEFAASTPFLFFADHPADEAEQVAKGRAEFLSQFPAVNTPEGMAALCNPCDRAVFERSRLNLEERTSNHKIYDLHKDLLKLRREDPVFRRQGADGLDAAVLMNEAMVVRYFGPSGDDRLVVTNFGREFHLTPLAEPLLAPPVGRKWIPIWSSNHPRYGGSGTAEFEATEGWRLPGEATVALRAVFGDSGAAHQAHAAEKKS